MSGYSVELDLRGKRVLVVGLGKVGIRKAEGLLAAGAVVIGVDPVVIDAIPAGCQHRLESFKPEHLTGVQIAFAAATSDVNRWVVAEAKSRGIWVNTASDPESGDLAIPATWRSGRISLAVSTSGTAPALARTLRDRAAAAIAPAGPIVELFAELRPLVLASVPNPRLRRDLLIQWAEPVWLEILASKGSDHVRNAWLALLSQVAEKSSSLHESPELS